MINKQTATHYLWGDHCEGWRLTDQADQSIIHEKMPSGTSEVRHFHNKATQFFFILLGVMEIEINGEIHQLNQHDGIEIRPRVPHQVFNESIEDLEFLVISHPNTKEDRLIAQDQSES